MSDENRSTEWTGPSELASLLGPLLGRTEQINGEYERTWRAAVVADDYAAAKLGPSRRVATAARRAEARRQWLRELVAHVARVAAMQVAAADADEPEFRERVALLLDGELATAADAIVRVAEVIT